MFLGFNSVYKRNTLIPAVTVHILRTKVSFSSLSKVKLACFCFTFNVSPQFPQISSHQHLSWYTSDKWDGCMNLTARLNNDKANPTIKKLKVN